MNKSIVTYHLDSCKHCAKCIRVCPTEAICRVNEAIVIDSHKCINCGLCQKKCPADKEIELIMPQKAYVAWKKDAVSQKGSSSGGVAAALYEKAIQNGWYVVGTAMDENLLPSLKLTNKVEDIEK